jgi:16S rRNA (guanine527-N7)-methyltransferase
MTASDVPRETFVEPEPPSTDIVLGAHADAIRQFAAALIEQGELRGLIGPRELERIWSRHLLNSAVIAPLLQTGATVADVGSGAGLPGLVLAMLRPDCGFVLIEPMERRSDWLSEQARALGLENVQVEQARGQDSAYRGRMDAVTARAVSALRTLLPIVSPLAKPGGELLLMKGAAVYDELAAAQSQVRAAGLSHVEVLQLRPAADLEATRVFRARVGR